ncbi:response regulator transcription factor [Kineosporia sp. A_224]|uniref:response regulator transcription factor n=1 Tax=Kineosporia sp. A_224 TaxID=1962180 RepID=UPI000B4B6CFB|nr:response regulator transcription factor [Kineosporia sp. A_224]
MAVILIVEDDPGVSSALTRALTDRGHTVRSRGAGMPGLQAVLDDAPDVVLLDLGLPDVDGLRVLPMLRSVTTVPVIITARENGSDVVAALDAGADDFVVKPFGADHLDARIRAVLRRSGAAGEPAGPIVVGGLSIDAQSRSVLLDGVVVDLSRKEFELLLTLARRVGDLDPLIGPTHDVAGPVPATQSILCSDQNAGMEQATPTVRYSQRAFPTAAEALRSFLASQDVSALDVASPRRPYTEYRVRSDGTIRFEHFTNWNEHTAVLAAPSRGSWRLTGFTSAC